MSLGDFHDAQFLATVASAEAALGETVRAGLFSPETELEFDWLERYESGRALIEDAESWEGCRVPRSVARRILRAAPPVDIWEHVVLRRFRAL